MQGKSAVETTRTNSVFLPCVAQVGEKAISVKRRAPSKRPMPLRRPTNGHAFRGSE